MEHVILDNQSELQIPATIFEKLFRIIIEKEQLDKHSFVNLRLSCSGEIRSLNKKYLGRDELTDVISFSSDMMGIPFLGDIIIDTNVADKQKKNLSLQDEIVQLFIHGILHLLNYDHLDTNQAKIMRQQEQEYFKLYKELE